MGIEVGIALHVDNIVLEGECMIIVETLQQLGSFLWELMQDGKKKILKVLSDTNNGRPSSTRGGQ